LHKMRTKTLKVKLKKKKDFQVLIDKGCKKPKKVYAVLVFLQLKNISRNCVNLSSLLPA
jgi:hypothetical protein